ncbi:hypothetical protein [Pseudonocardia sp.]|uniref:hypothetical protein n=1 Tax=Pseudonocardia sp. TaxID=60912 RepID=UPI003D1114CF
MAAARRIEFRVAGQPTDHTRAAFPDMSVEEAAPETIIVGTVADDAQLHGVLAQIQALGLRVVSMHEVRGAQEAAQEGGRAG